MEFDFEQVVTELGPALFRLAVSFCGNREDAEDAVQEVFLNFLRCGKAFADPDALRRYLMTATANRCRDLLKSAAHRHRCSLDEAEQFSGPQDDADARLEVRLALGRLEPKYRGVVYLFYYEDRSVRQIARDLGLTETAVRTRLVRARKQLKALLGGETHG